MIDYNVEGLKKQIVEMAATVEVAVSLATYQDCSIDNLYEVEDAINRYHLAIDEYVLKYIALKQPNAIDLRTALCALKLGSLLERVGDMVVGVKKQALKLSEGHLEQDEEEKEEDDDSETSLHYLEALSFAPQLKDMAIIAKRMLEMSIDSFVRGDVTTAAKVIRMDKKLNKLNNKAIRETTDKMKNSELSNKQSLSIMKISKNFERIGDGVTSMAQSIILMISGEDLRHNPDLKSSLKDNVLNINKFLKKYNSRIASRNDEEKEAEEAESDQLQCQEN